MSKYLKVSAPQMERDYQKLNDYVSQIPELTDTVILTMEKLSQCWEGKAWQAFQKQVADDIEHINRLYRFLMNYLSHMEASRQKYIVSEQEVFSQIDKL